MADNPYSTPQEPIYEGTPSRLRRIREFINRLGAAVTLVSILLVIENSEKAGNLLVWSVMGVVIGIYMTLIGRINIPLRVAGEQRPAGDM